MEKRARSTAKIVLFFTYYAFFETIRCTTLKITDPNVCPRKSEYNLFSSNFIYEEGAGGACPAGRYGFECLQSCVPNWHGVQCNYQCDCTDNKKCDPVHGCVCSIGSYGSKCSNACPSGSYGINCKEECFCAHDAKCDPVTGSCLCSAGWFGDHCTKECHQGYYDYNLNYNCSGTCVCNDGATCNNHSGICECKNKTSCINIKKKQIPKDNTSTVYVNRNLFIVVATLSVSIVCVLLLALTYLLLGRYLKHRLNRSSQNDGNETHIVQGHYDEINHYSETRDNELHDMRSSGVIENDNLQYRFQRTTNREHGYQNNAQALSNINMFEEQYHNMYCSLQLINEDYLNPYCALRFERRVKSCIF
ncbi:unnamed protein product [Mytilus coruscus]|uniref:EGF-like domain-containing protein n=1 Tax=Mytilus coruscus TaxID=42192 RepID=A0A6J8C1B7_MYTCO|nr:unnamed protein product [Mytilus coruscus]